MAERQGGYTRITKIGPAQGRQRADGRHRARAGAAVGRSRPPSARPRRRPSGPPRRPPAKKAAAAEAAAPAEVADDASAGAVRRGLARPAGRRLGARGLRHQGQRGLEEVPHPGVALVRPDGRRGWFATQEAAEAAGFEAPSSMPDADEAEAGSHRAGRRHEGLSLGPGVHRGTDEPGPPMTEGPGLVRVRLDLGYDGAGFSGWAAQPGLRTVEGTCPMRWRWTALRAATPPDGGRPHRRRRARHGQVAHVDLPAAPGALPGRSRARRPSRW